MLKAVAGMEEEEKRATHYVSYVEESNIPPLLNLPRKHLAATIVAATLLFFSLQLSLSLAHKNSHSFKLFSAKGERRKKKKKTPGILGHTTRSARCLNEVLSCSSREPNKLSEWKKEKNEVEKGRHFLSFCPLHACE